MISRNREVYFIGGPLDLTKQLVNHDWDTIRAYDNNLSVPVAYNRDLSISQTIQARTYKITPVARNNRSGLEVCIGVLSG